MKREKAVTFKSNPMTLIGSEIKVGDHAPDFKCVDGTLTPVTLKDTPAKARLFSVVPSIDTAVCSMQTHKFDTALSGMKDKVASYTFSLDTPFAQKRFCSEGEHPVGMLQPLSDMHDHSFGKNYGVLLEGLPIPLLTRAVFIIDAAGVVKYVEYVKEVTDEPNYDNAVAALKAIV
jgi:thioredoxin-dependent peroxiredoxin